MSKQYGYSVESENRVVIDHYKTLLIKSSASQVVFENRVVIHFIWTLVSEMLA